MRQIFDIVVQCYVGTQLKNQKGNRVGGNREIQHTGFRLAQDAQGRPGLGCKHHPSTTKDLYATVVAYCPPMPHRNPNQNPTR